MIGAGSPLDPVSGAASVISGFLGFIANPGKFFSDALTWLIGLVFPPELQTWFLGTIGGPGRSWDASDVYQGLFHAVQAPALLLAAMGAAARLVRGAVDPRGGLHHGLLDVLPRFLLVTALIGLPGSGVSLGYAALVWAVNGSMLLARDLFSVIIRVSSSAPASSHGWFTGLLHSLTAGRLLLVALIGIIPLLLLLLYAVFLMVVRTIMIGFCVVTAPLAIATIAIDAHNRFIAWWVDLAVGALMTPVVFAIAIPLSLSLAAHIVTALVIGPVLAVILLCGGLWFAGKMVHALTWRHFSHGGALAGFAAGVATMLSPLHKLSTAGFMAEALGANRDGQSSTIGFMKRMGLASQGFNPATGASTAMLSAAGVIPQPHEAPAPAAGIPDIAADLSPAGRNAVAGHGALFSAQAFAAFARAHPQLIGSLTKDVSFGHVLQADRARLAWERIAPAARRGFADDFLSIWLGTHAGNDVESRPTLAGAA